MDSGSSNELVMQFASSAADIPAREAFLTWVDLARQGQAGAITIRLVDEPESAGLNEQFRHRQGPTNVLSFAAADGQFPLPTEILPELGDLVICAPLVAAEAAAQGKSAVAHWAHLTLHGVLHLRGFDHQTRSQQAQMEAVEIELLRQLGIANPYLIDSTEL